MCPTANSSQAHETRALPPAKKKRKCDDDLDIFGQWIQNWIQL